MIVYFVNNHCVFPSLDITDPNYVLQVLVHDTYLDNTNTLPPR